MFFLFRNPVELVEVVPEERCSNSSRCSTATGTSFSKPPGAAQATAKFSSKGDATSRNDLSYTNILEQLDP